MSAVVVTRSRHVLGQIRSDSLVRNSLFLMLTTATMALAGFGFWVVNARLYTTEQVGQATALVSAIALLSQLSLAGMNSTIIRHLSSAKDPGDVVSAAVGTVALAAGVLAVSYLALVPLLAPSLTRTVLHPVAAVVFVVLTVGSAINLFTDSIFVARRAAWWNFALDGLLMGMVKLTAPFVLVGLGMFGIFVSVGAASTLTAGISLAVCHRFLGLRLRPRLRADVLKETWSYSAANYAANALNLLPVLVLPLALLSGSGAVATAGFFIAFQIATIFNSISYAVCEAMFAESSHQGTHLRRTAIRALGLIVALLIPAVLFALLGGDVILSVFGPNYLTSAGPALVVLSVAAFAVALYSWGNALLRITGHLTGIVVVNLLYSGTIIGLAVLWADRGPVWAGLAWAAGNLIAGLLAVAVVVRGRRG